VIVAPNTDIQCLGQLTTMARELVKTTLVREVARHLGTPKEVLAWLRSLPQSDDDGHEHIRAIACDVWQRVRLFPDDPNCVERSFAALVLLEVLDPHTRRMLVTIDRPLRHTGVVEKRGSHWVAIDLFPQRNALDWAGYGLTALHGVHDYVGKPILKFYLGDSGGKVADALGDQEKRLDPPKKKSPPPKKQPKPAPPVARPVVAGAAPGPKPQPRPPIAAAKLTTTGGQPKHEETQRQPAFQPPVAAGWTVAADADKDDEDAFGEEDETQRWRWW
jgi:hypothetical protein